MGEHKEVKTVSLGFFEALTLLFIGLKLTGCISWSWLWVLSPLWLSTAMLVLAAVVIVLLMKQALLPEQRGPGAWVTSLR